MTRIVLTCLAFALQMGVLSSALAQSSGQAPQPYSVQSWHLANAVDVDVFTPPGPAPITGWAAVLLIPGGGWSTADKSKVHPLADALVKRGFLAVATTYRTAPQNPWPAQLEDVALVVWHMRVHAKELQLDPRRIAALGASAGSLLAGHLGTRSLMHNATSAQVQRVISIGGPWDLGHALQSFAQHQWQAHDTYPDISALGMMSNLFGGRLPSMEQAQQASPQYWIQGRAAPTLFLHGAADTLVPPLQSQAACDRMKAVRASCQVMLFPGVGHTITPDFLPPILSFLKDWQPS